MRAAACALFIGLSFVPPMRAAAQTLAQARQRWLHGNYRSAQALYETLLKEPSSHDAAVIGLSRAMQSQGEYEAALRLVDTALEKSPANGALHARRAELLYLRGQWDDAEKAAAAAMSRQDDSFLARWIRAQIERDSGDVKKADAELRWFVRTYSSRSDQDKDIKDPEELLLVGLAGAENAALASPRRSI